MAAILNVLRTCGLIFYIVLCVHAKRDNSSQPWILSFKVVDKSCDNNLCKYLLNVNGGEFLGHNSWRLTPRAGSRGDSCDVIASNFVIREIETAQWTTQIELIVPYEEEKIFFCLLHNEKRNRPVGGKWVHQGSNMFLEPHTDSVYAKQDVNLQQTEKQTLEENWVDLSHDIDVNHLPNVQKPTRHEAQDIEVLIKDKYVPLSDVSKHNMYTDDIVSGVNNEEDRKILNKEFKFDNSKKLSNDIANVLRRKRDLGNVEINSGESGKGSNTTKLKEKVSSYDLNSVTLSSDQKNTRQSSNMRGNVDKNVTDDLISTRDIINAKIDLKNALEREKETENYEDALIKIRMKRQDGSFAGVQVMQPVKSTVIDVVRIEETQKENAVKAKNEKENNEVELVEPRIKRQAFEDDYPGVRLSRRSNDVVLYGVRVEHSQKEAEILDNGAPSVMANTDVTLRLYGTGLTPDTVIVLTTDKFKYGDSCKYLVPDSEYKIKPNSVSEVSGLFEIKAPKLDGEGRLIYFCIKKDDQKFMHMGSDTYKALGIHEPILPDWGAWLIIFISLCFSCLFSGLNLGLMSLDKTELKIIANTGTETEKRYAKAIIPVRDHGNYLLCSILLGNVAVNSIFTVLLDSMMSGLFAVIFSTIAIVLFGEITPQAVCSRHGILIGAKTIMITKLTMAITAPIGYPISKLLDYVLGEEIGSVYNRERLKELVKLTTDVNQLDKEEVNIISGALELCKKSVADIMTKIEDVFMLPINAKMDFETMSEIVKSGYSRIPVYENERGNIVTVLFVKDLAFVDPDDKTPLRTLCQYYQNPCNFVFEDVTLDVMFKQFKEGHKGHMAFVHRINTEGEGDPFYETIGLVTLEDVIEEMIQAEIVDETDVYMDNRSKRRRKKVNNKISDFAAFAERHEHQHVHISPQLQLATFQYLSSSVDAFRPDMISETVLRRMLRQDVINVIKVKGKGKKDNGTYVYHQGKPVDYFVMILEGRVEVTVGQENLVFEAGPFTYFGVQALTQNVGVAESPTTSVMGSLQSIPIDSRYTFVPDYSVRAVTDLYYLTVKRTMYMAAKRATLMEKGALSKGGINEQFDTEVDKLFQSVDEDTSISGDHKTPSRQVSPNPPVSASPLTRASFTHTPLSPLSPPLNGHLYPEAKQDEQEKLLKSP